MQSRTSYLTNNQCIAIGLGTGAGVAVIIGAITKVVFMPKAEAMFRARMERGEIVVVRGGVEVAARWMSACLQLMPTGLRMHRHCLPATPASPFLPSAHPREPRVRTQDPENPDWYVCDTARIRELETQAKERKAALEEGQGKSIFKTVFKGLDSDVHAVIETDVHVGAIHSAAEVFDARTEEAFKYLQVFTAMSMSFAHGANDIANSVGPMAGIWYVYKTSKLTKKTDSATVNDMYWLLALGALGICLGLSTLGYIIMRTLGVKVAKMTPTRGFAAELGAAFIIVIGSKLGLPLSTTHCITGSVVGIGLTERSGGVNYWVLPKIIAGWVLTLIFAGLVSSLFFSMGYFAPGAFGIRDRNYYQTKLETFAESFATSVSKNTSLQTSANYASTWSASLKTLNSTAHTLAKTQVINRYDEGAMLDTVLSLLMDSSTGMLNSCKAW